MQEVIKNLIKQLSQKGISRSDITIYLQGIFDGTNALITVLDSNKMSINDNDSDPLFVYTWNHVIDKLIEHINHIIEQTAASIPKVIGDIDACQHNGDK